MSELHRIRALVEKTAFLRKFAKKWRNKVLTISASWISNGSVAVHQWDGNGESNKAYYEGLLAGSGVQVRVIKDEEFDAVLKQDAERVTHFKTCHLQQYGNAEILREFATKDVVHKKYTYIDEDYVKWFTLECVDASEGAPASVGDGALYIMPCLPYEKRTS